jgi:phosphoribosylglycinamide formyltransferase 2
VLFSEVSPRPHDTGLVTLASQDLSEFALHVRAILGLPLPAGTIPLRRPSASAVVIASEQIGAPVYRGVEAGAAESDARVLIFGKPEATPGRRMGVAVASADDTDLAREKAVRAATAVSLAAT